MSDLNAQITPYRQTHAVFGRAISVQKFPFANVERAGNKINSGINSRTGNLGTGQTDILQSGGIHASPINDNVSNLNEGTVGAPLILRASQWTLAENVIEYAINRKLLELDGITYSVAVAETGDFFLEKNVAAAGWNSSLAADIASFGQPPSFANANVNIDRLGVGNIVYDSEDGFLIRWFSAGTQQTSPDVILAFYFGGMLYDVGYGQFCLVFNGDGTAELWEYFDPGNNAVPMPTWNQVDKWRYSSPHDVGHKAHSMRIFPHASVANGYIEFRSDTDDQSSKIGANMVSSTFGDSQGPRAHLFKVPLPADGTASFVIGPGNVRYDVRRDQRISVQVSSIGYDITRTFHVTDLPIAIPYLTASSTDDANAGPVTVYWAADYPGGTSITPQVYDADTGAALALISSTPNSASFTPATGDPHYYVDFEIFPTATKTPIIWRYNLYRDGISTQSVENIFEPVHGPQMPQTAITDISITGPDLDPSHDTASFTVHDYSHQCDALGLRTGQTITIETEYDPNDPTKRMAVFQGEVLRTTRKRVGTYKPGGGYPADRWNRYYVQCNGMWERLQKSIIATMLNYGQDLNAPTSSGDGFKPWKITDIVADLLSKCGYPDTEIDVPDSNIRLLQPSSSDNAQCVIKPLTNIAEYIVQILKDYIGWYLIRDPNAGIFDGNGSCVGMWRVIPPQPLYTNVLTNFNTIGPPNKSPVAAASYGGFMPPQLNTFIMTDEHREGIQEYIKAPENNAVLVTTTGALLSEGTKPSAYMQWYVNLPALSDPTSQDYTDGQCRPLVICDPNLGDPPDNALGGGNLINMVTLRYSSRTTHAIPVATFEAPLVAVVDPLDSLQVQPRPCRLYDTVSITDADGFVEYWKVRSCNPKWDHDYIQTAYYELWQPWDVNMP